MQNERRKLLVMAASLPVSMPVLGNVRSDDLLPLCWYAVASQPVRDGVKRHSLVLVNSTITTFDGDGYYLYPDWGNPVVYEVRAGKNYLAFHYPGSQQVLWKLSGSQDKAHFSGKVEGVVDTAGNYEAAVQAINNNKLQVLQVHALPRA